MSLTQDLKVQIAGDATRLLTAVDSAERKLVSLGTTSTATSDRILNSNRKVDDSFLATSRASAAAAAAMVASDAKVIGSAEKTGGALQTIHKHALAGTAAVAGLFGGYEAAKGAVDQTVQLAMSTALLSKNTGTSVEQSSQLVEVTKALGLDQGQLAMGIRGLSKATEAQIASTGTAATAFDKLGISQQTAAQYSGNTVGLLELVADRLKGVGGGTEKVALLNQLFGRSWQNINPLIRDGGKALAENLAVADKYGITINSKTLPQLLALGKAQREAKVAGDGLKLSFTELAGKPMIDFEDHLAKILNDIRAGNWADLSKQTTQIGDGLEKVIEAVTPKVANAFAQSAPKILGGLFHGFEQADLGGELIIGGLIAKKLGLVSAFAGVGVSAGRSFFEKLGIISAAAAPVEGAVAGREFAGAFDVAAGEGIAAGAAAGGAMAVAAAAAGAALAVVIGAEIGSKLQNLLPGEGGLSAAPGEGIGGGKVAPGALNGNTGGTLTDLQGQIITGWAQRQIGHYGETTGSNRGPELDRLQAQFHTSAAAWCAEFATTAAVMGGANQAVRTASVNTIQTWAQEGSHGYAKGLARKPMVGDEAILYGGSHVGFVNSVNAANGTFTSIEGNTNRGNGSVTTVTHAIGSATFARPLYGGATNPGSGVSSGSHGPTGSSSAGALKSCLLTYYDPRQGGINIADPKHPFALANGGTWKPSMMGCAAPPSYPFGTKIQFIYGGRSVAVTVVDRGGAIQGNHFDLQPAPAAQLGMMSSGKVTAQFRVIGVGTGASPVDIAKQLATTQADDFSNYQQAVSDVALKGQSGLLTPGQVAGQDRQIGESALKGGYGPLDSHMLLQVQADIAGATSGAADLKKIESAAQKKVLSAGHNAAAKQSALVSRFSTQVAAYIAQQTHTEALQALFPTDLSTPAGEAKALANLHEQKAAKSHVKDLYTQELAAIKAEIAAWTKSRDTYRKLARKAKGSAKTEALRRAAGLQANIDQGVADAATIGGNISDAGLQVESLDVQIAQTTADATQQQADAAAQVLSQDFSNYQQANSDIDLQVAAGLKTQAQGDAEKTANAQKALQGGFGALTQRDQWQVMADLKNATTANTTAIDANTQAQLDATTAMLQFTQAAAAIQAVETSVAIKALSDIISGQIVGVDYSGRSQTAGTGSAARYRTLPARVLGHRPHAIARPEVSWL